MSLLEIGKVAQALITDPLIGSASGYALVAASPLLSRGDADQLERQPLVSDYLHLLAEQKEKKFFAYHPLPSGGWALTQRFLQGQRRGSFNRVVLHALVLPPDLLAVVEDPRTLIAHARFEQGGKSWVQLASQLAAEVAAGAGAAAGVAKLEDLDVALPADFAELRVAQILSQLEGLRRIKADDARLHQQLVAAFSVFSGRAGRLLLGPEDELLFTFLSSVLPFRERAAIPWATYPPPEASEAFRLVLVEDPRGDAERLRGSSFTLDLESSVRVAGAEALADLFFRPGLLEEWLRQERALGASLADGRGQLAAQVEYLLRGKTRILEGFETWAELKSLFARMGPAASAKASRQGRADSWQDPTFLLTALAATLLRQAGRDKPEVLLRAALDACELAGLVGVLCSEANLLATLTADPGRLGQEGKTVLIGLALLAGAVTGGALDACWRHFPARLAAEPSTESFLALWRQVFAELVAALVASESPHAEAALELWAEVCGLDKLVRAAAPGQVFAAQLLFGLAGKQGRLELQQELAEKVLAPALVAAREAARFDAAWIGAVARVLAPRPSFAKLAAALWSRLALHEEPDLEAFVDWLPGLDRLDPAAGEAVVRAFLPKVERLSAAPVAEALVERLRRLAAATQQEALERGCERRHLQLGRATPLVIFERILAATAGRPDPQVLARELLGQLSQEPAQRLRQGLALLSSRALTESSLLLLEAPFLDQLLSGAGAALAAAAPPFEEIARDFGPYAQLLLARALGAAAATEFLRGALRAERMDLVGAYLRAAGGAYLRKLDRRQAEQAEVIRGLKLAWADPRRRLDLYPWGAAIVRLREAAS